MLLNKPRADRVVLYHIS